MATDDNTELPSSNPYGGGPNTGITLLSADPLFFYTIFYL